MFHLKVPFTFGFHLSINIGTKNTNLELFDTFLDWWRHNMVSKHPNFEIVVSKRNTSLQISFYHWLSSLFRHWFMEYNFGPILTQLWVNDVTTGVKPTIFLRKRSQKQFYSFIKLIASPQSFIKYWFQSIYHPWYMIYNFGKNLEIMTSQKKQIF